MRKKQFKLIYIFIREFLNSYSLLEILNFFLKKVFPIAKLMDFFSVGVNFSPSGHKIRYQFVRNK